MWFESKDGISFDDGFLLVFVAVHRERSEYEFNTKVEDDETIEAEKTRSIEVLKVMRVVAMTTSMLMNT